MINKALTTDQRDTGRLCALLRNRLKSLQYRPGTLNGFIAETGLTLDQPP
jgi:hypothetical protein